MEELLFKSKKNSLLEFGKDFIEMKAIEVTIKSQKK